MARARIVAAGPGDARELTAIAHEAKRHWGYPGRWIVRWKGALTVTPGFILANPTFCAVLGGRIVGFCALKLGGATASVEHLWVRPGAMGRGIGRSLFRRCEAGARDAGAALLSIESDPHAEGFYNAMGAVTVGRRPAPMDGAERFLALLEKRLARRVKGSRPRSPT